MLNFVPLGVGIKLLSLAVALEDTGWAEVKCRLLKGRRVPTAVRRRNHTSEIVSEALSQMCASV